jgi:hypothetical protein
VSQDNAKQPALNQLRITKVGNGSRAVYVEHDDERCYRFREEGRDWQPCQVEPTG